MSTAPLRTPAECFTTILQWLGRAVDAQSVGRRLAAPLIVLLLDRIRGMNQRFARLAARIATGRFAARRTGPRRKRATAQPRRKNPLPQKFGWLLAQVPETAGYRAQLDHLMRDPAMAALMQAAPGPMARILRPLCWMLHLKPPPILAPPRRATSLPPARTAQPRAATPRPPKPTPPSTSTRTSVPPAPPARACGPPLPLPA